MFGFGQLSFTIDDQHSAKASGDRSIDWEDTAYNGSHTFDPAKKITRVETIFSSWDANRLEQINFYSKKERLVRAGDMRDYGKGEFFKIAKREQLIGCELSLTKGYYGNTEVFDGVTWLKIKQQF